MIIKLSKWKILKKLRSRIRREEQVHKNKKKYNRKYTNPKIDPERVIEGTVEDN